MAMKSSYTTRWDTIGAFPIRLPEPPLRSRFEMRQSEPKLAFSITEAERA
jgi:hypothetical protein